MAHWVVHVIRHAVPLSAAVVLRSMLRVSPSAYQDACETMGPENAAAIMACILQRAGHTNSAGDYLRSLTAKAKTGEFSLGPVLMALMRTNASGARERGNRSCRIEACASADQQLEVRGNEQRDD